MSSSSKILVTGANGMIGIAIISKLLKQGKYVRAFSHKKSDTQETNKKLEWVYGSILDVNILDDICTGIETIIHCDEMVSFILSEEEIMYNVNVVGTENIVNAAISNKVKKIIYLSSTLAFGTYVHKVDINEDTKWVQNKQNSYYSICKNRAELEITRGKEEGLETVILNPSLIIGRRSKSKYNLLNIANANYKFYPNGINGFVGLDDVVSICIEMIDNASSGEKYILNAENLSYHKVLEQLNSKLSKKKLISDISSTKINLIWKVNHFRNIVFGAKPFLTKEILNFHQKEFKYSNEKVVEVLNFEFTPITKVIEKLK